MNKYMLAGKLAEAGATESFIKDFLCRIDSEKANCGAYGDCEECETDCLLRLIEHQQEEMARSQYNLNEAKENANATRVVLTTLDAAQAEGEQA